MSFRLFKEILTEKCHDGTRPYSQGRFYLFLSVATYFITIGLLVTKALKPTATINETTISTVISAIQWAIFLFAGYSFGGKGVDAAKAVMNSKYMVGTTKFGQVADASAGEEVVDASTTTVTAATTVVTASQTGPASPLNPPLTPP